METKLDLCRKEEWRGYVKGIRCEIVKWNYDRWEQKRHEADHFDRHVYAPTWNYYIYVDRQNIPDRFEELLLHPKPYQFHETSPIRYIFDHYRLESVFSMHCGITYYELIRDELGTVVGVKVGCDYKHLHDEPEFVTLEQVQRDLEHSVETFCDAFPDFKVWSIEDGKYYPPSERPQRVAA